MHKFERLGELTEELSAAYTTIVERFGLEPYDALSVCAALEVIASPLKLHALQGRGMTRRMGKFGMAAYYASLTAKAVEEVKLPISLTVNPIMESIIRILVDRGPLIEDDLKQD